MTEIFQNDFKIILPEFFFITAILGTTIWAVVHNASGTYKFPIMTTCVGWLSVQTLGIVVALFINDATTGAPKAPFGNVLIADDMTWFIKIIILLSAFASILISFDYIKNHKVGSAEYITLITFSTFSMLFIVSSYDLISMYLAIELQSLCFYVIAASRRDNEFSVEAGLKYFILGALSSGILLFGESIVYGFTGITNFEELSKFFPAFGQAADCLLPNGQSLNETTTQQEYGHPFGGTISALKGQQIAGEIGVFFMFVAFLFKIGAVPFHMWTPDVYEGAPTSVTAFFAITPKIAILGLFLRLCLYTFWDLVATWQEIIIVCALLSMFIGTFGAINQNKLKRLFAYSSIAHVGYLLIALATGSIEAVESLLIYVVIYIFATVGAFGVLLSLPMFSRYEAFLGRPSSDSATAASVGSCKFSNGVFRSQGATSPAASPRLVLSSRGPSQDFAAPCRSKAAATWFPLEERLKQANPLWDLYASFGHMPQKAHCVPPLWSSKDVASEKRREVSGKVQGIVALTEMRKRPLQGAKHITDLSSLSKSNPLLAFTAAMLFFSNAGVPPLAGFYGKLNVFLAAVESSMYFIALFAVICNVMGSFYSIRLVKILYFHNMSQQTIIWYKTMSKENSIVLAITFFFTFFFFLYPSFLFTITHSAALSLCV